MILKVLFVCVGNTCRSPIAQYLGNFLSNTKLECSSAGIHPVHTIQSNTVRVLQELYSIDASSHNTTSITELNMDDYDMVIALESMVYKRLQTLYPRQIDKLLLWEVADPYQKEYQAYIDCAKNIEIRINNLLRIIG